jgi:RimJ/RimL family protein N-acetyltransferase
MSGIADLHAALGLVLTAGPIELRGITDDVLLDLAQLAAAGIHDPAAMPFSVPWTDTDPEHFLVAFAAHHWRCRVDFSVSAWTVELAVFHEGRLVGVQGFSAKNFLVTRSGETGSWLGREHQGQGIGTAMRQAVCAFAFDHLGAAEVTSGAFLDNPASLAVSRRLGYRPNGRSRLERREGELAELQRLVLRPEDLVRSDHDLEVEGLAAFRRSIGLT